MAKIIRTDGTGEVIIGINKGILSLKQINECIGGYFEVLTLPNRQYLLVDEEGLLKRLPPNIVASQICGIPIVGNAILCNPNELD